MTRQALCHEMFCGGFPDHLIAVIWLNLPTGFFWAVAILFGGKLVSRILAYHKVVSIKTSGLSPLRFYKLFMKFDVYLLGLDFLIRNTILGLQLYGM